jgi:H/ACA ribonucleoprotein complex non-core subunit NAF1
MNVDVQPTFKVPESIPQDLLLIQDLVGEVSISHPLKVTPVLNPEPEDDDISSSAGEDDSEDELDEVEADLEVKTEENDDSPSPMKV